ncbi:sensor histidine kinase [Dermacoccaceae bacterium W4C1]
MTVRSSASSDAAASALPEGSAAPSGSAVATAPHEPEPRRPRRWGIRERLVLLVATALALGLLLAGIVSYLGQRQEVSQRIDDDLAQEVSELRQRAQGTDESGAAYSDVSVLLTDFIRSNVPAEDEAFAGLVGPGLQRQIVAGGERRVDLSNPAVLAQVRARVRPGSTVFASVQAGEQDLRVAIASVQIGQQSAVLIVGIDQSYRYGRLADQAGIYFASALLALLLTTGVLYLAVGRLMRPLGGLLRATERIDHTDLGRRVPLPDTDTEISDLARTFNRMLDRLEDAFTGQRQFLDDAAHELRTPLTIMRGNLEVLDPRDLEDVEATREIEIAEIDRMRRIVDDLLLLAKLQRPDTVVPQAHRLEVVHARMMALVPALGQDRLWQDGGSDAVTVSIDADRVVQAVQQLCANAVKFSAAGDAITVESRAGMGMVEISVTDTGVGISPEAAESIFERFDQGERTAGTEGNGLGLSIVRAIAHGHGGRVELDSTLGVGSTFRIVLPQGHQPSPPRHEDDE